MTTEEFVLDLFTRFDAGDVGEQTGCIQDLNQCLTAADALAAAGDKAENALGVLTDGPGFPIGYDDTEDTRMQMARASLRALSATLRQYREASDG